MSEQVFESYKEIHESYQSMLKTITYIEENKNKFVNLFIDYEDIILLGCGSSYWLSLSIARVIENVLHKKAYALKATEVSMHHIKSGIYKKALVLIPTRSGSTTELLTAIRNLKETYEDACIVSISEYENNTVMSLSDVSLFIPWANEVSVCQTRSFLNLYVGMLTMVGCVSDYDLIEQMISYLHDGECIYKDIDEKAKSIVAQMKDPNIVALGSGVSYGAMIEGAYIVEEMAQTISTFYHTLEYRHGPIVTTRKNSWIFLCHTNVENLDLEIKMLQEASLQGAHSVICGVDQNQKDVDLTFALNKSYREEIHGLYFTTILQHIAYYLSIKLGNNPDKPGNLVKFITY